MMPPERIAASELLKKENVSQRHRFAERLAAGDVFVYPTETIYGIGGRCDVPDVYTRIITIKQRAPDNPMILLGASVEIFESLQLHWTPAAKKCAAAFWPGLLTLVLQSPDVPEGVAIRVSDHPVISTLGEYCSAPVFSSSANISGESYDPDPDHIWETVGRQCDFMIDAGFLPPSSPSTVVRFDNDETFFVLREGCVSTAAIKQAVGNFV